MYSNQGQTRAFTLIELLIVVAIIGIVSGMLTANYQQALQRADRAATQHNLHTLHTALSSYRLDYGRFPLADCLADSQPRPEDTAWGCGPAANGYWCGVPLVLAELGYCPADALYDPALRRRFDFAIQAYDACEGSSFTNRLVPQWRYLRYAYNAAAIDSGGYEGGEANIESEWQENIWLVRSLHLDVGAFDPERAVSFPYRFEKNEEDGFSIWRGEYELTVLGDIQSRLVKESPL